MINFIVDLLLTPYSSKIKKPSPGQIILEQNEKIERYERKITDLENRIRELETDVTVKKRIKLEKEEKAKILTGKVKELEQKKNQDMSSLTTNK
ncbi:9546_t:CDS:2 [Rhizophagus irregularis]|nr:9546_t:CDS:2 [Rhizophagus irregularis]